MKELTRDRKKQVSRYLTCRRCHTSGGTLVKINDEYECQDRDKCNILQLRKR